MKTNKIARGLNLKNIFFIFAIGLYVLGNNVFAADNVLQAIQVSGVNDSYNIVFKSDDVAEIKKTVQAPNKLMITLDGIRASKTINTIYNNTSNIDSVVVEPVGDDRVKILVQGENAANAQINFDSLKTPLGLAGNNSNAQAKQPSGEIVLSDPVEAYRPVYNENQEEDDSSAYISSFAQVAKKALKNDKISWLVTFGLFGIMLLCGIKLVRGKDSEIKVGLTQSLKEREVEMYRAGLNLSNNPNFGINPNSVNNIHTSVPGVNYTPSQPQVQQNVTGNYGLRAYQQGTRSSYVSSEIQRPRPAAAPSVSSSALNKVVQNATMKPQAQSFNQNAYSTGIKGGVNTLNKQVAAPASRPKTANIDSMKFLESMTKIYEKNGRADLAQGLKSNMKKAQMTIS